MDVPGLVATLHGRIIAAVGLSPGTEYVLGREPLEGEAGIVVDAPGVSRRHLALRVGRDAIEVEDLGSTHGTRRNGVPIAHSRVADRPTSLTVGDVELTVTPPQRGGATELRRDRVVTTESLRRILAIICRDHVVPPINRGAWILTDDEISAILGGKPNAATVGKDIKRIATIVRLASPATRETLIDWAVASREVTATDAADLDRFLVEERSLPTYDDRVRTFPRSVRLRLNLAQAKPGK